MTSETVSLDTVENTRKIGARIESEILRRLASVTQEHAAACMNVSPSTVSRLKEDLAKFSHLLGAIGLQVAGGDSVVVDPEEIQTLENMAAKYLQNKIESRKAGAK